MIKWMKKKNKNKFKTIKNLTKHKKNKTMKRMNNKKMYK